MEVEIAWVVESGMPSTERRPSAAIVIGAGLLPARTVVAGGAVEDRRAVVLEEALHVGEGVLHPAREHDAVLRPLRVGRADGDDDRRPSLAHLVAEVVLSQRAVVIQWLVIVLYAGELVWKEREVGAAEIGGFAVLLYGFVSSL